MLVTCQLHAKGVVSSICVQHLVYTLIAGYTQLHASYVNPHAQKGKYVLVASTALITPVFRVSLITRETIG
jgi:hypothetical protein